MPSGRTGWRRVEREGGRAQRQVPPPGTGTATSSHFPEAQPPIDTSYHSLVLSHQTSLTKTSSRLICVPDRWGEGQGNKGLARALAVMTSRPRAPHLPSPWQCQSLHTGAHDVSGAPAPHAVTLTTESPKPSPLACMPFVTEKPELTPHCPSIQAQPNKSWSSGLWIPTHHEEGVDVGVPIRKGPRTHNAVERNK